MLEIVKKPIRKTIVMLARQAAARPWLRARAKRLLDRHPRFKHRLRSLIIKHDLAHSKSAKDAREAAEGKVFSVFSPPAAAALCKRKKGQGAAKKSPLERYADSL